MVGDEGGFGDGEGDGLTSGDTKPSKSKAEASVGSGVKGGRESNRSCKSPMNTGIPSITNGDAGDADLTGDTGLVGKSSIILSRARSAMDFNRIGSCTSEGSKKGGRS